MLSHDNVTWSTQICTEQYQWNGETHLSYLPMCHVAPLMIDGYIIPCCGGTAFIADKNALKGTLVDLDLIIIRLLSSIIRIKINTT